jgi:hypothetical protein
VLKLLLLLSFIIISLQISPSNIQAHNKLCREGLDAATDSLLLHLNLFQNSKKEKRTNLHLMS